MVEDFTRAASRDQAQRLLAVTVLGHGFSLSVTQFCVSASLPFGGRAVLGLGLRFTLLPEMVHRVQILDNNIVVTLPGYRYAVTTANPKALPICS